MLFFAASCNKDNTDSHQTLTGQTWGQVKNLK